MFYFNIFQVQTFIMPQSHQSIILHNTEVMDSNRNVENTKKTLVLSSLLGLQM